MGLGWVDVQRYQWFGEGSRMMRWGGCHTWFSITGGFLRNYLGAEALVGEMLRQGRYWNAAHEKGEMGRLVVP